MVKDQVFFMNKTIKRTYGSGNKYKLIFLALSVAFFVARSVQMILQVSVNLAYPGATLYLFDFHFYIGTRTFIGSILTLLTPHITYQQIFGLNLFIYVALILSFALLCFHSAQKAISENNNVLFGILLAFITFPYSLLQYANWIGAYDLYLCLFAVLGVLTALSKHAHWLFPLICVMAIFTHYSFVFAYFPAIFAVHLYCAFIEKEKKSRILSATTAFLSSFITAVYCAFFANNTIKMTRSELLAYMESRLEMPVGNERYIDAYYFNDDVIGMIGALRSNITDQDFLKNFTLFFLPIMLCFCLLWCNYIIKTNKNQIIPCLCFLVAAAVNTALIFIIPEYPRWQTAAALSQFIIFFVLIKKEDSFVINFLKHLNKLDVDVWFIIYVVFVTLASLAIKPYDAL